MFLTDNVKQKQQNLQTIIKLSKQSKYIQNHKKQVKFETPTWW